MSANYAILAGQQSVTKEEKHTVELSITLLQKFLKENNMIGASICGA